MHCACRTTALRIFIRNVAPLTPSEFLRASFAARSKRAGQYSLAAKSPIARSLVNGSHSFHASSAPCREGPSDTQIPDESLVQSSAQRDDQPAPKDTPSPGSNEEIDTKQAIKAALRRPGKFVKVGKPYAAKAAKERAEGEDGPPPKKEDWQVQKRALKEKFPEGWNPRKKLSPDAMEGIRALNQQYPDIYTTEELAKRFEMSPEAIRRILKSKWRASPEEEEDRQQRWFNRGRKVWERWAELGKKPPQKWRLEGVARDPSYHEKKKQRRQRQAGEVQTESPGKRYRLTAQQRLSRTLI
ncbi:uncharacterized protein E0L32_006345 [Thyridium curvatum]|uniref:Required for respiratory growth protein 9, mitochondrial n=1 Tax=Thyridium curvatum TaxID=1093900 RepID=A0A507AQK7_9PEZI|nr:uncharacterized protein E0L32_006345 [Thyridium curvatum]TPX13145.1 hypothetical protein E0L32_006345 [Thyridium curvatum]